MEIALNTSYVSYVRTKQPKHLLKIVHAITRDNSAYISNSTYPKYSMSSEPIDHAWQIEPYNQYSRTPGKQYSARLPALYLWR